jgi:hypothetical protein
VANVSATAVRDFSLVERLLAPIADQVVAEGATLSANARPPAAATGHPLAFRLDPGAPAGAQIAQTGLFTWTPTAAQAPGTYRVTVSVQDPDAPYLNT